MAVVATRELVARIDALLPQTQCRRCGYSGCLPYAEAVVYDGLSLNLCPPGGERVRNQMARVLERPLDPPTPIHTPEPRVRAFVLEQSCIGCTKCIQACPVDAIVGAAGMMHTVVERWCTGCGLCVAPCPTDCIEMQPADPTAAPCVGDAARSRHLALMARRRLKPALDADGAYVQVEHHGREELNATVLAAVGRRRAPAQ